MPLHVSSTVLLITRSSKLNYTAPDIVTPVGGRSVHRLRERETSVNPAGFEATTSASKLPQTHDTDRATTGVSSLQHYTALK